jgi:hypothetical protein
VLHFARTGDQGDRLDAGGESGVGLTTAVRTGGNGPGDRLLVDIAEIGHRQAVLGQEPVEPVERHAGLHRDQVAGDRDRFAQPVQQQPPIVGDCDVGERVPAADRLHFVSGA